MRIRAASEDDLPEILRISNWFERSVAASGRTLALVRGGEFIRTPLSGRPTERSVAASGRTLALAAPRPFLV